MIWVNWFNCWWNLSKKCKRGKMWKKNVKCGHFCSSDRGNAKLMINFFWPNFEIVVRYFRSNQIFLKDHESSILLNLFNSENTAHWICQTCSSLITLINTYLLLLRSNKSNTNNFKLIWISKKLIRWQWYHFQWLCGQSLLLFSHITLQFHALNLHLHLFSYLPLHVLPFKMLLMNSWISII